ncbi:Inner membrane protein YedI [Methylobacterium adhaesivum]|uniref:DUF808 domain-containing protein n=1 Tax=Methylobacterium adhaesivum TaxID=333297 RepID=A0ABT8BKG7_9HYPH|nr:DUF808 domain-containing protein [Methylobacterium adhaesivum]MDN3592180.1 DUF808 domain-containing protein [Methylobacterium adhaesivum]GJD32565.1 Inner membrane protein YedI [Methylobacterium adhaesivum]
MSVGLLALLDDVAALARVAAASLDDVAAQAGKAGTKALGIVIDDAAVTPRYVVGFAAARELPIVWRIAVGSLKNKLLFLLPGALLLSYAVPWVITPLLMLGGLYLCYEGAEKILHAVMPAPAHAEAETAAPSQDAKVLEDQRVRGAIQTDFILSAEVMALTLASLTTDSTVTRAAILAIVGIGVTLLVYGVVALIVKADDAGVALAANDRPASTLLGLRAGSPGAAATGADRALRPATQGLGRALVVGMPYFLSGLAILGTAAMLWVGGGILLHGLEHFGVTAPAHLVHEAAKAAAAAVPSLAGAAEWLATAILSGLGGLVVGGLTIPVVQFVLAPATRRIRALFGPSEPAAARR